MSPRELFVIEAGQKKNVRKLMVAAFPNLCPGAQC